MDSGGKSKRGAVKETSPDGRFVRFSELLGRGAFKIVYRGLDRDRGVDIAWNQLNLDQGDQLDHDKIQNEINTLKNLRHQNVIDFYDQWANQKKRQIIFITECMTSGTLTDFIRHAGGVKLKLVQTWSLQILNGLAYLHSKNVIHRDIKCDNIFISGSNGEVKIGDLGLATVQKFGKAYSVIGTPEFMAPEFYSPEEVYDTKVDIWAFGLCLLEMITMEYPYKECSNAAQVFRKVSSGGRPDCLKKVKSPEALEVINSCLQWNPQKRPSAEDLRQHSFFQETDGSVENLPRILIQFTEIMEKEHGIENPPRQHKPGIYKVVVDENNQEIDSPKISGHAGASGVANPPLTSSNLTSSGSPTVDRMNHATSPAAANPPPTSAGISNPPPPPSTPSVPRAAEVKDMEKAEPMLDGENISTVSKLPEEGYMYFITPESAVFVDGQEELKKTLQSKFDKYTKEVQALDKRHTREKDWLMSNYKDKLKKRDDKNAKILQEGGAPPAEKKVNLLAKHQKDVVQLTERFDRERHTLLNGLRKTIDDSISRCRENINNGGQGNLDISRSETDMDGESPSVSPVIEDPQPSFGHTSSTSQPSLEKDSSTSQLDMLMSQALNNLCGDSTPNHP